MLVNAALILAGREGAIKWPPDIGYTIGIEVKASHYYTGEQVKILGALDERRGLGINDLTFMHLGIVKPATRAQRMDEMFAGAGTRYCPERTRTISPVVGVMLDTLRATLSRQATASDALCGAKVGTGKD